MIAALKDVRPEARAVVLTGYGNIATAVTAVKLGAVDYLAKPADADDVYQALIAPGDAKARIAALSPVVIHGAARGDPAALRIVDKETERLAAQIVRAYAALNHRAILSLGGALVHEPVYQAALLRHVGSLPWLRVDAISDAAACAARAT